MQQYLDNNKANKDISHETEFMIMRLKEDKKSNYCFFEAKNIEKKPERGRRDLINRIKEIEKNEKSGLKLEDENQVIRVNMDAYFEYTINL